MSRSAAMDVIAKAEIPTSGCPALGRSLAESFVFLKYVCVIYGLYFSVVCQLSDI
jgi:hypothetical protein